MSSVKYSESDIVKDNVHINLLELDEMTLLHLFCNVHLYSYPLSEPTNSDGTDNDVSIESIFLTLGIRKYFVDTFSSVYDKITKEIDEVETKYEHKTWHKADPSYLTDVLSSIDYNIISATGMVNKRNVYSHMTCLINEADWKNNI
jgi:hypothetical protein